MLKKSDILLPLFSLLVGLALLECAVRLMGLGSRPATTPDRPLFFYVPESAKDMRGWPATGEKTPGVFRAVIVGDSFTFAPMVQFDDTLPARLDRLMNLNGGGRAEVINLGTPGFSTKDEVKSVEDAAKLGADLIVLQITLNDAELKMFGPEDAKRRAFGKLRITKEDNPILYHWKTAGLVASRIHNTLSNRRYRDYFLNIWRGDENWRVFTDSVNSMSDLCRKKGVKFAAVVFPIFSFPADDNHPFLGIHKKISDFLDSAGVVHLDLFDAYRGMDNNRLQIVPGFDSHPNEIALRIAAEKTYAFLLEKGLIPDYLRAKNLFRERKAPRMFERFRCPPDPAALSSCSRLRRGRSAPKAPSPAPSPSI